MLFKHCEFLLKTKADTLAYCLKYRDYFNHCPEKCPFFLQGESGTMEDVSTKDYIFDCLYFTRFKSNQTESNYYCELYEMYQPLCKSCQFPKFKPGKE